MKRKPLKLESKLKRKLPLQMQERKLKRKLPLQMQERKLKRKLSLQRQERKLKRRPSKQETKLKRKLPLQRQQRRMKRKPLKLESKLKRKLPLQKQERKLKRRPLKQERKLKRKLPLQMQERKLKRKLQLPQLPLTKMQRKLRRKLPTRPSWPTMLKESRRRRKCEKEIDLKHFAQRYKLKQEKRERWQKNSKSKGSGLLTYDLQRAEGRMICLRITFPKCLFGLMPRTQAVGVLSTKLQEPETLSVSSYLFQQDVIFLRELAGVGMAVQPYGGQYNDMEKAMT
jgi:hypothetical protein